MFQIVYLPVNQAWLVMFGDSRLAGPFTYREDAEAYLREISEV